MDEISLGQPFTETEDFLGHNSAENLSIASQEESIK